MKDIFSISLRQNKTPIFEVKDTDIERAFRIFADTVFHKYMGLGGGSDSSSKGRSRGRKGRRGRR